MAGKYELYQDKRGEYRWRLRHQNGNIIADSGEGYTTKAAALNGIESVKSNVAGAEIKDLSVAEPKIEPAPPPPPSEPKPKAPPAKYELYQDKRGEYCWRLRHQNGNIIADSGEGYSSKASALNGIESVKSNVAGAEIKDLSVAEPKIEPAPPPPPSEPKPKAPPAKYELYQDKRGEYRWRLRHQNGNIIADSGEGYTTKASALNGIESVKSNVAGAEIKDLSVAEPKIEPASPPPPSEPKPKAPPAKYELYQDKRGEYRWRLRHQNGNIIADSGEGYTTKAAALNGIESVKGNVAGAEIKELTAAEPEVKPEPIPIVPEPKQEPTPVAPVTKQEPTPIQPEVKPEQVSEAPRVLRPAPGRRIAKDNSILILSVIILAVIFFICSIGVILASAGAF